jgi:hypothetical protein
MACPIFLVRVKGKAGETMRALDASKSTVVLPMTVEGSRDIDLTAVQEQIATLIGQHAIEMVDRTIVEVCKGHYPAMKYLFELAGLRPKTTGEEVPEEDSLAKTLLLRLQALQPAVVVAQGEDREAPSEKQEQHSHPVK